MMTAETKAAWLSARAGKLTASRMAEAMGKKGPAARKKLMFELLAERTIEGNVPHFVSPAMEHGLEYEDEAVDMFVSRFPQYDVRLSRFYEHPTIEFFGASPDREVGHDGLLEVKCPSTEKYLGWVMDGAVPIEHKPQMAAQILCSGKKWCGFLAYDPRIKVESQRLFMKKYEPTAEYLAEVEREAIQFLKELDFMFEIFVSSAA